MHFLMLFPDITCSCYIVGKKPHKKFTTTLERVEWQANYAAACFLMPEKEVITAFNRLYAITKGHFSDVTLLKDVIKILAEGFHVTSEAMLYRVQELKEKELLYQ